MRFKNATKVKEYIFCILYGIYFATVLWITLFSRIGTETRSILFPFHSYIEVLKGNWRALWENLENIMLFIPYGFFLGAQENNNLKRAALKGLLFSLGIEIGQRLFLLGTMEFDDLIHNTLGAVIGTMVVLRTRFRVELKKQRKMVLVIALLLASLTPVGYHGIRYHQMGRLATLHNRDDGTENLLVLSGKSGYAWETNVYVKMLSDGSIKIEGTSDRVSWWPIANITLQPGKYTFGGLSGVEQNTVGLELETDNHRFAPDVGPVQQVGFTIDEVTKFKVYVIVYPDCDCDVIATPVLYKEE